ncbi:hypothetical protein KAI46_11520 [bacterium]|nr:hypothetical protein [bacterium]
MKINSCKPNHPLIEAQVTGIGWVNASGFGWGTKNKLPVWGRGTPQVPHATLKSLKGGSRFGRLDLFSQIGVAAVGLALQDAGRLQQTETNPNKSNPIHASEPLSIGLVCSTTSSCSLTDHSFYDTVIENPHLASPGLFVYTLATSFLGEAALRFSIKGSSIAIIEPQPSASDALCTSIEELTTGDEDIMIAGLCNLFSESSSTPRFSGALFLILEKEGIKTSQTYAALSCNPQKRIFYCNNKPCPDIFSLCERLCG